MGKALGAGGGASSMDDYDAVALDEEEERLMNVELSSTHRSSNGHRPKSARQLFDAVSSSADGGGGGGGSSTRIWTGVLFLLALVGVYQLGQKHGEHKIHANYDDNGDAPDENIPWHEKIMSAAKPTKSSSGSFTQEQLKATRAEGEKILSLLEEYYSGKEQTYKMLMTSWADTFDFDPMTTDPEKLASANKLVDTMARALVTDTQKTFLMGGIGSSVMAGHDNCHYDSYQSQMERFWQPVWEAAGMKFVFQNAGEGGGCGDNHQNQVFCVKQNLSPDVDIIHYSWTYFEAGGGAVQQHEQLIRWAQMLPKQPIVHILDAGEADYGADPNNPATQLVKYYSMYGHNIVGLRLASVKGGYDYQSEKENGIDRFGWGYVGDGYHNTTRYGEGQNETRRDGLGIVMQNWHPGPLGFQTVSDAFTYVYTQALLNALDLIEKDMNDGNDPRKTWSASERRVILKRDLPEPKFCDPEYCVVNDPPECKNYELPTFGKWGARVEAPDGDLNPYKGEKQGGWVASNVDNDLWYMVDTKSRQFFQDRDDKEICRHLDACGGIHAQTVDDGMVVFRLPKMEVGLVVICGHSDGYEAPEGMSMFINNTKLEISFNTVPLDHSTMDVFPNSKCARLLKRFPTSGRESQTPTGHHYLAIKILNDMERPVSISHIITL